MIEAPARIPDFTRLKAFAIILLAMFGSIIARLWYLQIVKGAELAKESETLRTRTIRRVAARGVITDAKGTVLATSRPHYVVSVLPDEMKKNPDVLPLLAKILETDEALLKETLGKNKGKPFDPVPVARDV